MKKISSVIICMSMLIGHIPQAAAAADNTAPKAPAGLLTNELEKPLNVEEPAFFWLPQDDDYNEIQTAYEIVVTDTLTDEIVWDSGKVTSSEQSNVNYGGTPLEAGHPYFWQVRTWDRYDERSPYSEPAEFATGLSDDDWNADWIKAGDISSSNKNAFRYLRKEVELEEGKTVQKAFAYIACCHDYELNINGSRIGRGQSFDYPDMSDYQGWDVTDAVGDSGSIAVGITARWYGSGQGRFAGTPGLIGHIKVYYTDGTEQIISTDGTWKTAAAPFGNQGSKPTTRNSEGDFTEIYDARNERDGWVEIGYDDSSWSAAQVIGTHPIEGSFSHLEAELGLITEDEVSPVSVTKLADGSAVADFGKVIPARFSVHFNSGVSGTSLKMQTGYELRSDGSVNTSKQSRQSTDMSFTYIERDGEQTYNSWDHLGFRYLQIPDAGEEITTEDITARIVHAEVPAGRETNIESSDEMLNGVYELMARSALYSAQNSFVDTPTREKGQFLNDAFNISAVTTLASYERTTTKKAILQFLDSADRYWNSGDDLGRYNSVYPNGDGKRDIPDFSLNMPEWVLRYYMTTGDKELLKKAYPYLKETGNYITRNISSDTGLVTKLAGGENAPDAYLYGIVDWPAEGRFGYDWAGTKEGARTPVNMLSVRAFDDIAKIAEELGETADTEDYSARAAELRRNINDKLINSDGIYCDGLDADGAQVASASQHNTSYALAFGIAPSDSIEMLSKHIAAMGMKQGPMTADILTEALFDAKQPGAALSLLTNTNDKGWAKLINDGNTFTWESWEYVNEYSLSHGWGAAAAKQIIENIAGVKVTEAGASRIRIAPVYGLLGSMSANVATERGAVGVGYSGKKGDYSLKVTVPVNVTADVVLPIIGDGGFVEKNGADVKSVLGDAEQTITIGSGVYEFVYDGNITEDGKINDAEAVSETRDAIVYNINITGSGTLITAVYDGNGRLINTELDDVTGGSVTKTVKPSGVEKGTTKFMLWSTMQNLKPLSEAVTKAWDISGLDFVWDFSRYSTAISGTGEGSVITDEYDGLTISIADNPNDSISSGGVFWNGGAASGESIRYIKYTPSTDGTLYATGRINSGSGRWGITDTNNVNSLKGDASSSTSTSNTTVYSECKAGTTYYILNKTRSARVSKVWFTPAQDTVPEEPTAIPTAPPADEPTAIPTAAPTSKPVTEDAAQYYAQSGRIEYLDRGLAAMAMDNGVYLSWRLLAEEDNIFGTAEENVSFAVYKNGERIATADSSTNYLDKNGTAEDKYSVAPIENGAEGEHSAEVSAFKSGSNYFDIELDHPGNVKQDGTDYPYLINDMSCGDVDGDGQYELVVQWDYDGNPKDLAVITPNTLIDCYDLSYTDEGIKAQKLWRIDLGENVRDTPHGTQFLVYDFDRNGRAEVTMKTAPGSVDGKGNYVTAASHDTRISSMTDEENKRSFVTTSGNAKGYVLSGDEFFTIFDGETGAALDTVYFPIQLISANIWGDTYGNRCGRFTAGVAWLDGKRPYAVYQRGYYMGSSTANSQRQGFCAMSFDGEKLECSYIFDTYDADAASESIKSGSDSYYTDADGSYIYKGVNGYTSGNEKYAGNGNHNITVADVDHDGRDEYITGALCMEVNADDKLMPLWCTFKGHGDALHIGEYDPTNEDPEFFTVHEEGDDSSKNGKDPLTQSVVWDYGASLIDAGTGEIKYHMPAPTDTGRGMMANVGMGGYYQFWAASGLNPGMLAYGNDKFINAPAAGTSYNFRVFWDGDLYDELFDSTEKGGFIPWIDSWNADKGAFEEIFRDPDIRTINGTKANPSLQADLFGDWREELCCRSGNDNSVLRIYTTNIPTGFKMKTLMSDDVYRAGVAAEQTAYNQPPHIGYYVDEAMLRGGVTGISIDTDKSRTSYCIGDELYPYDVRVKASFKDGTENYITAGYDISGYNADTVGKQSLTVTYTDPQTKEQHSAVYEIEVVGISRLEVVKLPDKTTYYPGQSLDTAGFELRAVYEDGSERKLTDGFTYTFDNSSIGTGRVTVELGGAKCEFDVTIHNEIADVSFDEAEYSSMSLLQKNTSEPSKYDTVIGNITYNPGYRNNGDGDGITGFKTVSDSGDTYLSVGAGRYCTSGRNAYMYFKDMLDFDKNSAYTFKTGLYFDPAGTKDMKIDISDGTNIITSISAEGKGLEKGVWYTYKLVCDKGEWSECFIKDGATAAQNTLSVSATKITRLDFTRTDTAANSNSIAAYVRLNDLSFVIGEASEPEETEKPAGPTQTPVPEKYMHISFDDVYSCLKDITVNEYSSVFENSFFSDLKGMHDTYGAVFTLNCFNTYSGDSGYDISKLPSRYADELANNSDWLRFAFHAEDDKTQYSATQTSGRTSGTAEDIKVSYKKFTDAVMNATGNNSGSIDTVARLGFFAGDADCIDAVKNMDYGITGLLTADDTRVSYYFDDTLNNYILANNEYYDSERGLQLILSQTRLESVKNTSQTLEGFKSYNGKILEIFTHESEYSKVKARMEAYIKWAHDNGYGFGYAMDLRTGETDEPTPEPDTDIAESHSFTFGAGGNVTDTTAYGAQADGRTYGLVDIDEASVMNDMRFDGFTDDVITYPKSGEINGTGYITADYSKYDADTSAVFGDGVIPIRFAMAAEPESYYTVSATVVNTSDSESAEVSLFGENRYLILYNYTLAPGESITRTWNVNLVGQYYNSTGAYTDNAVNVAVAGKNAGLSAVTVKKHENAGKTMWLCTDSTGDNSGANLPYFGLRGKCGVGQVLTKYIDPQIAINNQGEGGLTSGDNNHLNNILKHIKPGDHLYVQYGFNGETTASLTKNLDKYYNDAHNAGAKLIVVSTTERQSSSFWDSSAYKWNPSNSAIAAAGKAYVEAKIAAGADDIAFVDLNTAINVWMNETGDAIKEQRNRLGFNDSNPSRLAMSYYYGYDRDSGVDSIHINDAGADNAAYIVYSEMQKTVAADTPVQADVLRELVANNSASKPYSISDAIVSKGWVPNDSYPYPLPSDVTYEYPNIVKSVDIENNAVSDIKVMVQGNMQYYSQGAVDILDSDGNVIKTFYSTSTDINPLIDHIDNTACSYGEVYTMYFDTAETLIGEGESVRAYTLALESGADKPTDERYSSYYTPEDGSAVLLRSDFSGGTDGWSQGGSAAVKETSAAERDGRDALKISENGSGTYNAYRRFDNNASAENGIIKLHLMINYAYGNFTIKLTPDTKTGSYINGAKTINVIDGALSFEDGTEIGRIKTNKWTDIDCYIDLISGTETVSIAGGAPVSVEIPKLRTEDASSLSSTLPYRGIAVAYMSTGSTIPSYSFEAYLAEITLEAIKCDIPKCNVSAEVSEGEGILSGTGEYEINSTVTLNARAADGYEFAGWYDGNGTALSKSASYAFRVRADKKLYARFEAAVSDPDVTKWTFSAFDGTAAVSGNADTEYNGLIVHTASGDSITADGLYWSAPGGTKSDATTTVSNNRYIEFTPEKSGTISITYKCSQTGSNYPRMYISCGDSLACTTKEANPAQLEANKLYDNKAGADKYATMTAELTAGKHYYIWAYYYSQPKAVFTISDIVYNTAE